MYRIYVIHCAEHSLPHEQGWFLGPDLQYNKQHKTSTHIIIIFKNMFTAISDMKWFAFEEWQKGNERVVLITKILMVEDVFEFAIDKWQQRNPNLPT